MANIKLNNNEYPIPDSALAAPTADFVAHLGTIAGNGLKVVVGGVEYGIDSTKVAGAVADIEAVLGGLGEERLEGDGAEYYTLAPTALSFRSTAPLDELQEIQINGVTVDPANYTLEEGSTIVTFPIDYLKTLDVGGYEVNVVSEGKEVKGNFTVAAPELNEHGFYYNQPYSANLPMFGGDTAFFVREDGTYDIITVGKTPDTGEYTMDGNNIVATHPLLSTITCTISSDGTEVFCNELQVAFELNGSITIAADEDYIYEYKEDLGGYEVRCIDKTKTEYGAIKTGINGIDTVKLADDMFADKANLTGNINMTVAPEIPDTVTSIGDYAFLNCTSLASIEVPDSVTTIGDYAFYGCSSLASIEIPDSVMIIGDYAFHECSSLTDIVIPDSVTTIGERAFFSCDSFVSIEVPDGVTTIEYAAFSWCKNLKTITIPDSVTTIGDHAFSWSTNLASVTFTGAISQWNSISKGTNWNYQVPATHVQCSDGTVAL